MHYVCIQWMSIFLYIEMHALCMHTMDEHFFNIEIHALCMHTMAEHFLYIEMHASR